MKHYLLVLFSLLTLKKCGAQKVVLLTRQQNTCQYGHDAIRSNHNVQPVEWDQDLAYGAEDWAIRCALKGRMEQSSSGLGENIFWTPLNSVACATPLMSWYNGIKNFDYKDPKWNMKDGTFIQEVYSTVSKFGVGIASYSRSLYTIGRYNTAINSGGPFDQDHIPKPNRAITKDDLTPKPLPRPQIIQIKAPAVDGWTEWTKTSECSADCGVGSAVEERWCVRLNDEKKCEGERKRTARCEKTNCGACQDLHMDCKTYANEKKYCVHSVYGQWMRKNCRNSCKDCDDVAKSVVHDDTMVSKVKLIRNKARAILL